MRKKEEYEYVFTVSCVSHKEASARRTTSQWGLRLEREGKEVRWAGSGQKQDFRFPSTLSWLWTTGGQQGMNFLKK